MGRGNKKKRTYGIILLGILLCLLVFDFVRGQNMVQYAYSHFQACLLEYDQALAGFLENGDPEMLLNAGSTIQHVEHMDEGFLKYICLSEPLYRKERMALSGYLRLLADYSEQLIQESSWKRDVSGQVSFLYEGNREIEELLVEDSMTFEEIGRSTRKNVAEKINEMKEMIIKDMNEK
ncbi:MAG: hypothetical protein KH828_05375 [Clostridiales bacterium]|nr:hypothetical protein [Clostridiales bacterium]